MSKLRAFAKISCRSAVLKFLTVLTVKNHHNLTKFVTIAIHNMYMNEMKKCNSKI